MAGIGAAILAPQNYVCESKSINFWLITASYVILGLAMMGRQDHRVDPE